MADTRYLWRKGGRWYLQLAVPLDIQPVIGRKVVQEALGTAELREARAKRDELLGEWRVRFRRARERKPPSPAEIDAAARTELRKTYEAVARDYLRLQLPLSEYIDLLTDELDDGGEQLVPADDGFAEASTPARRRAEQALRQLGAEATPEAIEAMRQALVNAQIEALESFRLGLEPPLPERPVAARGRRRQGGGIGFHEVAKRYVADRVRDPKAAWTAQTRAQNEATYRLFADHLGDAPLASIGRQDVAGFLDAIAGLHRNYGRSQAAKGLPLAELLARYPGPPSLTNKSLNRHVSALSGLFRWARKAGLTEGENPARDQMRPPGDVTWLPFNPGELRALFDGAGFEAQPRRHMLATARPWIMAVGLFAGMRLGEICELAAGDVRQEAGVWFFDITAAKSQAGVRRVPVHSELIRAGFLDYLEHIRAAGHMQLWPGIKPGGPDAKRNWYFTKAFTAYRRSRGVTRERVTFHSFRKCFVRALELAGVDRDRAALVVGHERGFTFRVYNPDGLDVAMLREVVELVRYEGLGLR